jgi:hypothetical protein
LSPVLDDPTIMPDAFVPCPAMPLAALALPPSVPKSVTL